MLAKVNEQGLLLTPEMLQGATQVEIRPERGRIVILLDPKTGPIFQLGKNPVDLGVTDASVNHDKYIYGTP